MDLIRYGGMVYIYQDGLEYIMYMSIINGDKRFFNNQGLI